ncbi:branched-chain amino acid transporter permease [Corynebacterium epidermidicanis]|uniref:Putative branched-chain amino acid permease n=1 Tax=Corynebacterium epidermidicanis TaxID=1050174 RepID=A0A0G3GTP5_9CORY|nr:AzlD domain-containing protein [Corynebacterium epidermidicanis]AKK02187.1 putative branched-chain amino acid permease [Corynebacterium epidermidicanis]
MANSAYVFAAIGLAGLVTFLLRLAPFVIKQRLYGSAFMEDLGRWMPLGGMVILAMYVTTGVDWKNAHDARAYGAGLTVTVVLHLWRKNMILSIVAGTAVCAILASW